ncbi:MAG TPA: CBS domain-containing protein [Actinomycetota bacterium]
MRILVRHVMTHDVATVSPSAGCQEIAQLMVDRHVRTVPVVEADGTLVGLVTEAGLLEHVGGAREPLHTVELLSTPGRHPHPLPCELHATDVMTRGVVTSRRDATVPEAIDALVAARVRGLPVVDGNGVLLGIVDRGDLLRGLAPMIRSVDGVVGLHPAHGRRRARREGLRAS